MGKKGVAFVVNQIDCNLIYMSCLCYTLAVLFVYFYSERENYNNHAL